MSAAPGSLPRTSGRSRRKGDPIRRAAARNGLPREPDPNEPLPKRIFQRKLFWLSVVMVGVYVTLLVLLY